MTLREKQVQDEDKLARRRETNRQNVARYRERHRERLAQRRREIYDPEKAREYGRRYREKNPERFKKLATERYKRRYHKLLAYANQRGQERASFVAKLKLDSGCADCGYRTHPDALEFDHVRGKAGNVSQFRTCSMERLLAEIAKCDVVCANCHRLRTASRRLGIAS